MVARGVDGSTTTYRYDISNKPIAAFAPGESEPFVKYYYDYRGNRYAEEQPAGGQWTYFQVDNNNPTGYSQVLAEMSATGLLSMTYTYGHDLVSAIVNPQSEAPNPQYFHYDGLGSTRVLTDSSGDITNRYGYTAFGNAVGSLTSETLSQAYRFTGERYDTPTGFYYLRARMYDPSVGRFTSFDPVEDFNNRLHKYSYCDNDPVDCKDLTGTLLEIGGAYLVASLTSTLSRIKDTVRLIISGAANIAYSPYGIYKVLCAFMPLLIFEHNFPLNRIPMAYTLAIIYFESTHLIPPVIEDYVGGESVGPGQMRPWQAYITEHRVYKSWRMYLPAFWCFPERFSWNPLAMYSYRRLRYMLMHDMRFHLRYLEGYLGLRKIDNYRRYETIPSRRRPIGDLDTTSTGMQNAAHLSYRWTGYITAIYVPMIYNVFAKLIGNG